MTFNRQRFFNRGVVGIILQGGPAATPNGQCLYRAPNGNKCAVGQNIPDHLYTPDMESCSPFGASSRERKIALACGCETLDDAEFATNFQIQTHDRAVALITCEGKDFMPIFRTEAHEFARRNNLSTFWLHMPIWTLRVAKFLRLV